MRVSITYSFDNWGNFALDIFENIHIFPIREQRDINNHIVQFFRRNLKFNILPLTLNCFY